MANGKKSLMRNGMNVGMNIKRMVTVFLIVATALSVETAALNFFLLAGAEENPAKSQEKEQLVEEIPDIAPDRKNLQETIEIILGEDSDVFAIYLLRPAKERKPWIYQSHPMRPASMIKLFVLAKAMQDAKDGMLSLDETVILKEDDMVGGAGILTKYEEGYRLPLRKVMELMITESDNTATNILIERIGKEDINQYLQEHGYIDTVLHHKMMLGSEGKMNLSSVKDIGTLLSRIYGHDCVGAPYDEWMIDILLEQKDRECFPAALPDWKIAHKTGEVEGLYDDGGIFYGREEDFVLVIMNDKYGGRDKAIQQMQRIARYVAGEEQSG